MDLYTNGKINIKKRIVSEWFLCFIFVFPLVQALLTELLGIPDAIKFICDGLILLLLVKLVVNRRLVSSKGLFPCLVLVLMFFVYTALVYLVRYQSVYYYFWGLRNNFRYYIVFFGFAFMLDWQDAKNFLKVLDWLYIVNFFVVLVEYFLGFSQDYLGGIFGVQKGCNGSLLIFMTIVSCKSLFAFMRREEKIAKSAFIAISSLMIATVAELKFYFFVFVIILIMASVMTKASVRKTVFLLFGTFGVILFTTLLSILYEDFSAFFSWKGIVEAFFNSNYATTEDIGRITAIPIISENFLTGFWDKLFGLGLGNCDSSSLAIFNTPFFELYGSIHYSYFPYAFFYLETGIIGLALYLGIFAGLCITFVRMYKQKTGDSLACQMGIVLSAFCVVFSFYNAAMRLDSAYLMWFALALPFISAKSDINQADMELVSASSI